MHRTGLTELEVFLAVVRHNSFRAAARELGMSATAVSNAVAGLESRLQVRLFHRTTRSVALTDTGLRYVERVAPAVAAIQQADQDVGSQFDMPVGTLRINAPPESAVSLFGLWREYAERYPRMRLDVVTETRKIDIVAEGFDAGIRLAEDVPQDMIAVQLTGEFRPAVVASPAYLQQHGTPLSPQELSQHQGIYMRFSHGGLYRWELEKEGKRFQPDIPARMVFNEMRAIRDAACSGLGIAYLTRWLIEEELTSDRLVSCLDDWCQPFPGLRLYYPGRRHVPAGLQALIGLIREKA